MRTVLKLLIDNSSAIVKDSKRAILFALCVAVAMHFFFPERSAEKSREQRILACQFVLEDYFIDPARPICREVIEAIDED